MNKPKPIYIRSKDRLVDFPIAEEIMIEELEKIKAEIKEEQSNYTNRWIMGVTDYPYGCYRAYEETIKLIDKHISELKGENNPDCRNCDKWKTCENGEKGHAKGTSIGYSIGECRDYAITRAVQGRK